MSNLIKSIISNMDTATAAQGSRNTLVLLGDPESVYLRGIERRAENLGLRTARPDKYYNVECAGEPIYVYDTECTDQRTHDLALCVLSTGPDIDRIITPGLSCCAEACLEIVKRMVPYDGCLVAVIGRGHAQQGLGEALTAVGNSVLLAHGDSGIMSSHIVNDYAEAIINTSSRFVWPYCAKRVDAETIIDVCGGMSEAAEKQNYFSTNDIGALNISVLLRRFTEV